MCYGNIAVRGRAGTSIVIKASILTLRRALALWLWAPLADVAPAPSDTDTVNQRLRAITDDLPAVVTQFDAQGRLVFANRFAKRRLGSNPEDMLGAPLRTMAGEALYARLQPHFEHALGGKKVAFEVTFQVDGIERSYAANYVPQFDATGAQTGVFALLIDITERVDSETRRAVSEQRLRTITDNLPIMIGFVDHALVLLFYNATFLQWMGRTAAEMAGKTLMDIVNAAGEERAGLIRPFIARALEGERVEFELAPTPGRTDKWLRMTFVPEVNKQGKVSGMYMLSVDVSQLKEVQMRLSEMAQFDELTSLPNRYQFNDKLRERPCAATAAASRWA